MGELFHKPSSHPQVAIGQLDEADRQRQLRYHVNHWLNDAAGQVERPAETLCELCYAQVYEAFVNHCEALLNLSTLGKSPTNTDNGHTFTVH